MIFYSIFNIFPQKNKYVILIGIITYIILFLNINHTYRNKILAALISIDCLLIAKNSFTKKEVEQMPKAAINMPMAAYDMPKAAYDMPKAAYDMPKAAINIPDAAINIPFDERLLDEIYENQNEIHKYFNFNRTPKPNKVDGRADPSDNLKFMTDRHETYQPNI